MNIDEQKVIEEFYSKQRVNKMIRKFITENLDSLDLMTGIELLEEYVSQDTYPSKQRRLEIVADMDLEKLVIDVLVGISKFQEMTLLTTVVGSLAHLVQMDKIDAIKTMSEILVVLAELDFYDMEQEGNDSWMIGSKIELSSEIQDQMIRGMYLPPMIVEPKKLKSNRDSGYYTLKESLILGSGNHHDGDICLDVLNLIASVPLKLDAEFIRENEEELKEEITADSVLAENPFMTDEEAIEEAKFRIAMFEVFKEQSKQVYNLLINNGNKFYLNQKVDKRGRVYAQGYHVSTAGTSYKKATVELYEEEIVEGI